MKLIEKICELNEKIIDNFDIQFFIDYIVLSVLLWFILLILKGTYVITWSYWVIFSPLLLLGGVVILLIISVAINDLFY